MREQALLWVSLLPALAALWIGTALLMGWIQGEKSERHSALVASSASGLSLLLMLLVDLQVVVSGNMPGSLHVLTWMESVGYRVLVSVQADPLSLSMSTLAALLGWLTVRFSVHYLHREEGFHRFFALLCLFIAALLHFLLAGNAVMAFIGWELMGLTSYLLIGYALQRPQAGVSATRVILTNRVGDAGFTVAILLGFTWLGGVEWQELAAAATLLNSWQLGVLTAGFLLAAAVKSAQFPFAAWISRALEGPTPSSAIFYGSLMIHAGVYLLLRLESLLRHSPFLLTLLILLGSLTVLYGVLLGLVQTDVKSSLICATQTQVGLMFLGCGLGWFEWVAWHMAAHAGWRAYQWLSAPSYMHGMVAATPATWKGVQRFPSLYAASLARFWLDPLTDQLLTKPTQALAKDLQSLEDRLLNPLLGNSPLDRAILTRAGSSQAVGPEMSGNNGLPALLLARLASWAQWLEDRILSVGGEGMVRTVDELGTHLSRIDQLFSEPRYLVLMIILTFVAIL
ncbi:proton-conducting transporter membrane subunit [Candidatus Magnetaquicoccus inordinatus]|uniref:proton-conducting transporter transmembrane domain-containing protein n=1 Tax=Candidatus Magnetaquicoccus inordinatus TaxID=2496818 RepID=UPI001D0EF020|nr:proton-conducting transporter membrane subunit [Candidatus Magnetaquicoccus inordinatus]